VLNTAIQALFDLHIHVAIDGFELVADVALSIIVGYLTAGTFIVNQSIVTGGIRSAGKLGAGRVDGLVTAVVFRVAIVAVDTVVVHHEAVFTVVGFHFHGGFAVEVLAHGIAAGSGDQYLTVLGDGILLGDVVVTADLVAGFFYGQNRAAGGAGSGIVVSAKVTTGSGMYIMLDNFTAGACIGSKTSAGAQTLVAQILFFVHCEGMGNAILNIGQLRNSLLEHADMPVGYEFLSADIGDRTTDIIFAEFHEHTAIHAGISCDGCSSAVGQRFLVAIFELLAVAAEV
jgi:hypothetical protein